MTWIGIDIDDTLYSFNNLAREVFVDVALERDDKRVQRGAYCGWGEWRSPADVTDAGVWSEVIARCHTDERIALQVPFPGAADTLTELRSEGYHLHYISNRRKEALRATEQWLTASGFPFQPDDFLTCNLEDKVGQLRGCQFLIDDRPKTLVEFVYDFQWKHRHGSENTGMRREAFGLYMPYNAALTDVPGIKLAPNWRLLRQYMIDQNLLHPRSLVGSYS